MALAPWLARPAVRVAASVLTLCFPGVARGQYRDFCGGPERSATPIDVTLDDLAVSAAYQRKAVRTRGDLEADVDTGARKRYVLRDGAERVEVVGCPEVGRDLEDLALRRPRIEVVGLALDNPDPGGATNPAVPSTRIYVWAFTDMSERERARASAGGAGLAEVLADPDAQTGRTVRVKAQFGGRNLLKDLPPDSAPETSAWVLRDGGQAIWVVGKRPEGTGFKLDPEYASDAGKWILVEGKLERCGALWCLRARRVSLSAPPS